jgi:ABC-type antimicrobial peptide transport system permease subunit
MALGASPGALLALVMFSGLRLTVAGVVLGLVIALTTTRLLGTMLYDVSPRDPYILATVVLVMTGVATLACVLPGWRAMRLDPMRALRL